MRGAKIELARREFYLLPKTEGVYMEEWKDIVGYEGIYQVSTMGQVRSLDRVVKNHSNTYYFKKGEIKQSNSGYE